MRKRVLAGVHGASPATGRRPRTQALLLPVISLLLGVALGATLVSALSSDPHTVSSARSLKASLQTLDSHAELSVSGMPEPPIGEVYEVWLLRAGSSSPQPTDALFTVSRAGSATVEVPGGGTRSVKEVLVSSEPLGGSAAPSGPVVLRVRSPRAR